MASLQIIIRSQDSRCGTHLHRDKDSSYVVFKISFALIESLCIIGEGKVGSGEMDQFPRAARLSGSNNIDSHLHHLK